MKTIGRNDKCHCGSGKKYKNCCLLAGGFEAFSLKQAAVAAVSVNIPKTIQKATDLLNAGRLQEAAQLYLQVVHAHPTEAESRHYLGIIAARTGNLPQSIEWITSAISINGGKPEYFNNLGNVYNESCNPDAAISCYRQALNMNPCMPEAYYNLGRALHQKGLAEDALEMYTHAVSLRQGYLDALSHKACLLSEIGRLEDALLCFNKLLEFAPWHAETHYNIGVIYEADGRPKDAMSCYQRAIELMPDYVSALNNLGVLYRKNGNFPDAVTCYSKAIQAKPDFEGAIINLGIVHNELGDYQKAIKCFDVVLSVSPNNILALHNRGIALQGLGRFDEAILAMNKVLSLDAAFTDSYRVLASIYFLMGRHDECIKLYRMIIAENPADEKANQALLFSLNYAVGISAEDVFKEHRQYGEFIESQREKYTHFANILESRRRLRIGYVSGDFKKHSVSFFLEPILARHNKEQFEVHCFSNVPLDDGVATRMKQYADKWHVIYNESDYDIAAMIKAETIDILVDLSGHTAGNALNVFARRPAPVQVTWLGYASTSGLSCMDYRLVDNHTEPEGLSEQYHTETLWRLPDSFLVYQPPLESPAVGSLPALSNGYVTFGSFNNFAKVTNEVVALWARILMALPSARLMLKAAGLGDEQQSLGVVAAFWEHGISAERLILQGRDESHQAHLARFSEVDIALDPFPCNGGTTTCDGYWMGVPIITIAGDRFISRMGVSMAHNTGLAGWVAQTPDEYVALAVYWSQNLDKLAELRAGMRTRIASSPLVDSSRFTRNLEIAYRDMWQQWQSDNAKDLNA